jgi:hypothetical protein
MRPLTDHLFHEEEEKGLEGLLMIGTHVYPLHFKGELGVDEREENRLAIKGQAHEGHGSLLGESLMRALPLQAGPGSFSLMEKERKEMKPPQRISFLPFCRRAH